MPWVDSWIRSVRVVAHDRSMVFTASLTPTAPLAPPARTASPSRTAPPTRIAPPAGDASRTFASVSPASPASRAPGVLDRSRRLGLADRVAALLHADEHGAQAAGTVGAGAQAPERGVSRAALREARGRLLDVEHALRSGIPLPRHGEHLAERLVDQVEAGAYAPGRGGKALRGDAAAACAALGSVTPFH